MYGMRNVWGSNEALGYVRSFFFAIVFAFFGVYVPHSLYFYVLLNVSYEKYHLSFTVLCILPFLVYILCRKWVTKRFFFNVVAFVLVIVAFSCASYFSVYDMTYHEENDILIISVQAILFKIDFISLDMALLGVSTLVKDVFGIDRMVLPKVNTTE